MDYFLLSIVTFIPALSALILLLVARGNDHAAALVAKRFALFATGVTFFVSLFSPWMCHRSVSSSFLSALL